MRRYEELGKDLYYKDRCGGEEKERKTEAEVDGQCKCRLAGEGTVGGGGAKPSYGKKWEKMLRKKKTPDYVAATVNV